MIILKTSFLFPLFPEVSSPSSLILLSSCAPKLSVRLRLTELIRGGFGVVGGFEVVDFVEESEGLGVCGPKMEEPEIVRSEAEIGV